MKKASILLLLLIILVACSSNDAARTSTATSDGLYTQSSPTQLALTITATVGRQPQVSPSATTNATLTMQETRQPTKSSFAMPTNTESVEVPVSRQSNLPIGEIFFWSSDHTYVQLTQLSDSEPTVIDSLSRMMPEKYQGELVPDDAVDLAFATYDPKVAYLTSNKANPNSPRELWLADVAAENTKRVWIDSNNWLGGIELVSVNQDSAMVWAADDRYVLITSFVDDKFGHTVIYDLDQDTADEVIGACNLILFSQDGQTPEIWCKLEKAGTGVYAALDADGIQYQDQPPEQIIAESLAWRISPDGKRVIYLGVDYQWYMTGLKADVIQLPFRYQATDDPYYGTASARSIVWSADGLRILLYGEDHSGNYCPPQKSEYTDESTSWPCWLVIDSNSGSVIWWPNAEMQLENSLYSYNMAMSPNGEWLVTSLSNRHIGHLYTLQLFHIDSGYSEEVYIDPFLLLAYYIHWY